MLHITAIRSSMNHPARPQPRIYVQTVDELLRAARKSFLEIRLGTQFPTGEVPLPADLFVDGQGTTIDGSDGACWFSRGSLNVDGQARHCMITNMRFRPRHPGRPRQTAGLVLGGAHNEVSQCSFAWWTDNVTIQGTSNIVRECLFAEALDSGHPEGPHSSGILMTGTDHTLAYCLVISCRNRNPRIWGGRHDVIGNTFVNAQQISADIPRHHQGVPVYVNLIGNTYLDGPDTDIASPDIKRFNAVVMAGDIDLDGGGVFLLDNVSTQGTYEQSYKWREEKRRRVPYALLENVGLMLPREEARIYVRTHAGALPRDEIDAALVESAETGTRIIKHERESVAHRYLE